MDMEKITDLVCSATPMQKEKFFVDLWSSFNDDDREQALLYLVAVKRSRQRKENRERKKVIKISEWKNIQMSPSDN